MILADDEKAKESIASALEEIDSVFDTWKESDPEWFEAMMKKPLNERKMNAVTSRAPAATSQHDDAKTDADANTSVKSRGNSAEWLLGEEKVERAKVDVEREVERALVQSAKTTSAVYVGGKDSDFAITTSAESADDDDNETKAKPAEAEASSRKTDRKPTPAETPVEEVESEVEETPVVLGQNTQHTAKSRSTVKTNSTAPSVVPVSQVLSNTSRRPPPPVNNNDQSTRRRQQQRQVRVPVAARERRAPAAQTKQEAKRESPVARRPPHESSFVGVRAKREVSFVLSDDDAKPNRALGDARTRPRRESSFTETNKDGGENKPETDAFNSARNLALARHVYTPTRELSNVSARASLTREKSTFSLKREKSNLTSPGRRRAGDERSQKPQEDDILTPSALSRPKPAFMTQSSNVTSKTEK